ncbi:amino acid ABC transporter ATP-binding protein [Alcaligenes faecalis]|uniref:ATP-binding cassette domain-containing protein n=1 Tax=Alcaligenes faecalis TaxID=511 RepID=UPI0024BC2594|nr:amino acid ABC transporter ATP-binding protein [Alcaligenes faecalis]
MNTNDLNAAVQVRDIHKRFGTNEVLKGISCKLTRAMCSPLWSLRLGQSTLLRCINHLVVPDQGEIQIGNDILRSHRNRKGICQTDNPRLLEQVRARLGMVFQNFNLWSHRTVLQNVTEGPIHVKGRPAREAADYARELLGKVGLSNKCDAYPAELSGGQQQCAIARALAMDPDVLLFDEPTSALDPEMVGEVLRVIRQLAQEGRTMILVTHEMNFARDVSSETIFMHNGLIEERGHPKDLFDRPQSERLQQFLQPMQ